ncbi:MAG: phosphoribosylglycinamide formyltransferase [Verrucomicrobiota bacterium]|nr:phosphoribosylglycinamide formyltransferase [Verrucomicrobiota bacterium]
MSRKDSAGRPPLRVAVLGSGKGSNCQSIIEAIEAGRLNVRIVCVISDVENAFILERARRRGIPAFYLSAAPFKTKLDGAAELRYVETLREHGAEVIALAGFMRMIKQGLLAAFPNRILNIHPALLPAFPGMESWRQALDYGAKVAGCTVHFVDAGMDTGPIIVQRAVPVLDGDTAETLHARIQTEERIAYPEALRLLSEGSLAIEGRRVRLGNSPYSFPCCFQSVAISIL